MVFKSGNIISNLAGIVGSKKSACNKNTKSVIIECAYFNPEDIIGKTVKYNLKSDAAHKFERGVDIASQEIVLRRFISIVQDHTSIKSLRMNSFVGNKIKERYLPIETERINKILGTKLTTDEYVNYLARLGFEIKDKINIPLSGSFAKA